MKREPIVLYLIRIAMGVALIALMLMLYWSSLLIEKDIKKIYEDINDLKEEIIANPPVQNAQTTPEKQVTYQVQNRPFVDPLLPNLLEEDPFYAVTLPTMLGPYFKPDGIFHRASLGKPDNLHPFSNWSQVSAWVSQCTVSVARLKFGIYETFAPDMAIKVEERQNQETAQVEFWVHLRDGVYWKPLRPDFFSEDIHLAPHFLKPHQVTANDFKFYFDAVMNPYIGEAGAVALRNYLGDIESIEVLDKLTFVVRWKSLPVQMADGEVVAKAKYVAKLLTGSLRPLASFVYKYFSDGNKIIEDDSDPNTYRTNSVWAQNFSQHWAKNLIVSCGPWVFDGMTDRLIRFKRNPNHYFPLDALALGAEDTFKDNPDAIWQDFKANKLDSYEIRPDQLLELASFMKSPEYQVQKESGGTINRLDFPARSYIYIGWNQAKPYFKSKKIRQALTMAINRRRIIQQNLNGLGIEITGPFYRYSDAYDASIKPWPFDVDKARLLLEEEGWYDSDGNGIVDKIIDGKRVEFRFSLMYYVRNPTTKAICEYVSTALKEIGVGADLYGVDIADLSAAFDGKSFDAICLGWALGTPPDDPRQLWYSAGAKEKSSSNAVGFSNAEADKIIDALQYETDRQARIDLYHRLHTIIFEEAPYVFLFTPITTFLYRDRLQNVFIPAKRQDLVPGANVAQPDSSIFWLKSKDKL